MTVFVNFKFRILGGTVLWILPQKIGEWASAISHINIQWAIFELESISNKIPGGRLMKFYASIYN
jgi:hypothetical protein